MKQPAEEIGGTRYTRKDVDDCKSVGEVTKNGVAFTYAVVSINGAWFTLIREPHHTQADITAAKSILRGSRDVVGFTVVPMATDEEPQNREALAA